MAEQDQLAQMPTQISPQALATLFGPGGAQTPVAPAQAPAGGNNPLDDPNLRAIIQQQSQAGLGAFGERERAAMDINKQLAGPGGLMEQQAESAKNLSFHPNFQGGFLHNLGQALLTVGAATRPGQAVQDVIYSEPRQEYAGRAERIKSLQEEQKALGEGQASAAQLAYKPFQAEAAEKRAGAAAVAAQARADQVIAGHQAALARIAAMKDIATQRTEMEKEVQQMRSDIEREVTGMKDVTSEDVARIMASSAQSLLNTKIAEDPSIAGAIKRWFGVGGAEAPGGEQPVKGAAPLPTRTPNKPAAAGAAPPRPANVPSDYVYKENGPKGKGWYKPSGSK